MGLEGPKGTMELNISMLGLLKLFLHQTIHIHTGQLWLNGYRARLDGLNAEDTF